MIALLLWCLMGPKADAAYMKVISPEQLESYVRVWISGDEVRIEHCLKKRDFCQSLGEQDSYELKDLSVAITQIESEKGPILVEQRARRRMWNRSALAIGTSIAAAIGLANGTLDQALSGLVLGTLATYFVAINLPDHDARLSSLEAQLVYMDRQLDFADESQGWTWQTSTAREYEGYLTAAKLLAERLDQNLCARFLAPDPR